MRFDRKTIEGIVEWFKKRSTYTLYIILAVLILLIVIILYEGVFKLLIKEWSENNLLPWFSNSFIVSNINISIFSIISALIGTVIGYLFSKILTTSEREEQAAAVRGGGWGMIINYSTL